MPKPLATAEFKNVEAIRGTGEALLCRIEGKDVWLPQSQIHENSEVYKTGDSGTLIITEWIAIKKGLV